MRAQLDSENGQRCLDEFARLIANGRPRACRPNSFRPWAPPKARSYFKALSNPTPQIDAACLRIYRSAAASVLYASTVRTGRRRLQKSGEEYLDLSTNALRISFVTNTAATAITGEITPRTLWTFDQRRGRFMPWSRSYMRAGSGATLCISRVALCARTTGSRAWGSADECRESR